MGWILVGPSRYLEEIMDYGKTLYVIRVAVDFVESSTRRGDSYIDSINKAVDILKGSPDCWKVIEECDLTEYVKSTILSELNYRQGELLRKEILPQSLVDGLVNELLTNSSEMKS